MASTAGLSPLFELPGELKNRIYRFALLEASPIPIYPTGVTESSLMFVSKQVRKETGAIFWTENKIMVMLADYNCAAILFRKFKRASLRQEFELKGKDMKWFAFNTMQPNWRNLMEWLRRYHEDPVMIGWKTAQTTLKIASADQMQRYRLVELMFANVKAMRDKDWAFVETLLLQYRPILESIETGWIAGEKR